jgi:hypothetical protein
MGPRASTPNPPPDRQDWVPEVPDLVGIYHSFVRGHNRDTRVHKLFIIVSGGCGKAADEFYNTVLDCHGHATAGECAMSEEAWWLKRASYRSRCRLITECAAAFGLRVTSVRDIHAYDSEAASSAASMISSGTRANALEIAVPTIDTVTHDMCLASSTGSATHLDTVHLHDSCVNINSVRNGVLCAMHPSEGFWIFKVRA